MYKYKYTCTHKHKTPPVAQPHSLPLCCFCVEECPRPPPRSLPPRPLGIHHHVHPPLFTADPPIPPLGLLPLFCLILCVTPSNKASCFDCTTLFLTWSQTTSFSLRHKQRTKESKAPSIVTDLLHRKKSGQSEECTPIEIQHDQMNSKWPQPVGKGWKEGGGDEKFRKRKMGMEEWWMRKTLTLGEEVRSLGMQVENRRKCLLKEKEALNYAGWLIGEEEEGNFLKEWE